MDTPVFALFAARPPALLWECALKSLILLCLAALPGLALRHASAASRHLLRRVVLCGLLCLPIFCVVLPQWKVAIRVVAAPAHIRPATQEASRLRIPAERSPSTETAAATRIAPADAAPAPVETLPIPLLAPMSAAKRAGETPPLALPWVLGGWLLGVLLILGQTVVGLLAARRMVRRCRPADARVQAAARGARRAMNVKRRVEVLEGDAEGTLSVPMTMGFVRALILLPHDTVAWPPERLRVALLHELAHIKRTDWPIQIATQIACALYWFNPLVWLLAHTLRIESEQACDDLVVGAGVTPFEYAAQLLEIARDLCARHRMQPPAVAMARRQDIQIRLRTILAKNRDRRSTLRPALVTALVAVAGMVVALAALRPVAAQTAWNRAVDSSRKVDPRASAGTEMRWPEAAGDSALPIGERTPGGRDGREGETPSMGRGRKAVLPDGVTVELLGIGYHPSQGRPWWNPGGAVLPQAPYDDSGLIERGAPAERLPEWAREMAIRVRAPSGADVSADCKVVEDPGISAGGTLPTRNDGGIGRLAPGMRAFTLMLTKPLDRCTLRLAVATAAWRTMASYPVRSDVDGRGATIKVGGHGVVFSEPYEVDGQAGITVSDTMPDLEARVVALDDAGGLHVSDAKTGGDADGMRQTTVRFSIPLAQIKELRLQLRPWQRIEFRNVRLQPGDLSP